MSIGTNLRKMRVKKKLSQQEVADRLEIDRVTYINWENETSDVKSQYIPKIAEIFDVEIQDLFNSDQKIQVTNNIDNKDKTGTGGVGVQKGKIIINLIITDENSAVKLSEQLEKIINKE
ncbi:helix-turn-helix transcriptional regulator [Chryseobacterium echinoideorum]|uniref:helix-turn-helix transcriptional regulator n=1 Tax=Chryseobacterium echinoideorum TaxID=1549648 RepID=UPI001186472E|nr:helix-turn-helix transcriptional regulator [Chryseobacterium echinoideorum]